MGRFFQNKVGFQSNRLAKATINQIVMKKVKFFIFHKLERFVLKSGKNENQQFRGNPPNVENLILTYLILINIGPFHIRTDWVYCVHTCLRTFGKMYSFTRSSRFHDDFDLVIFSFNLFSQNKFLRTFIPQIQLDSV